MAECVSGADMVVAATPTPYLRSVCERLAPHLTDGQPVVNVAKGIEEGTLLLGSQVIEDVCGPCRLAGLYGPSHAEEVARELPTTVVATSREPALAEAVQAAFMRPTFRVYTNTDILGVELGAALKNVIAIAAGICDGLGFGDNAKSALITRGLAEMARLGVAMGARAETFSGLTGLGDLITTCVSPYGRNRAVGERIGRGEDDRADNGRHGAGGRGRAHQPQRLRAGGQSTKWRCPSRARSTPSCSRARTRVRRAWN